MKRLTILLSIVAGIAVFSPAQTPGSEPFLQEGIASWYGGEFDGNRTASGEIFNSALFTAAHPTLPFGTILTVTNTENNRQVAVRVNDRGPLPPRIIDLSRAAAEALDILTSGTALVSVEHTPSAALGPVTDVPAHVMPAPQAVFAWQPVPNPAPEVAPAPVISSQPAEAAPAPMPLLEPQPAPVASPVPPSVEPQPNIFQAPPARIRGSVPDLASPYLYRLQVGSYNVPRNAVESFERLRALGLNPAYERHGDFYRVVLAGLRATDIPVIAQILGNAGYSEVLIRQETGF